jgi:hypothetical protein
LLTLTCHPAARASDPELASATRFVHSFYQWYVAGAIKGSGWQDALRDSTTLFAPALVCALRADADAQTRAKPLDGIVGLDWDPFLAAQDNCDTADEYEVGGARRQGQQVLVNVRGECWQRKDTLPDVVAEVGHSGSTWVFVNFLHGADTSDLLKDLENLRREREQWQHRQRPN